MSLISIQNIGFSINSNLLLDGISLQLDKGEKVALIGRNGAGKSTLMKIISRELDVDHGEITFQKNLKVSYLPQEITSGMVKGNVSEIIRSGLSVPPGRLVGHPDPRQTLSQVQIPEISSSMESKESDTGRNDAWISDKRVSRIIASMNLDPDRDFETLSGGQKKKVLLAGSFVGEPELLLLDEPTNHLDIDSICWLEQYLQSYKGCILFVTHDRSFMKNLANRIMELDRGKLFNSECDYETFLARKQSQLDAEEKQRDLFDKKLSQEEIWIRKGVRARRTRNEGRVKALIRMRNEKRRQQLRPGKVNFSIQDSERSGRLVIKSSGIGHGYNGNKLFHGFSTMIMRGDKIGVIGPNGSGKTTLLRILLGNLTPDEGEVSLGTNLDISYFDQLREELDEEKTVIENISGGSSFININNHSRHISGYLKDFLFTPEKSRSKISTLSGGERNRLLLAKLFSKTSNLLVMDEPTNDLDIETLELLEELLHEYPGTVLLVSHDRTFLNNIVTSTIALEGNGRINEYPGGYDDWMIQRNTIEDKPQIAVKKKNNKPPKISAKKGLSYKEKKELDEIMAVIQKLEKEHQDTISILSEPGSYEKNPESIANINMRLETLDEEIKKAYQRWDYLEKLKESFEN